MILANKEIVDGNYSIKDINKVQLIIGTQTQFSTSQIASWKSAIQAETGTTVEVIIDTIENLVK